jgi:energy-coupling factor transport system ATP-binding protein
VTNRAGGTGGTDAGLRFEVASVRYPGRREPALQDISAAVDHGEIVGVAGPTNAGKSTLGLLGAGFVPRVVRARVGGTVLVDGSSVVGAPASAVVGRVGIVFATPANQLSASKLTVREELAFGLENLGVPRDEMDPRIDRILGRLRIEHLAEREPFSLSGGEQQRVAIASIVAMGTGVLVLDEPTAQLDPAGTREIADLLGELARSGTAVLCAEHSSIVLGGTARCLLLDAGRLVVDDVPGAALGSAVLAPRGLSSPTLVRLAEAAGLGPDLAFNETAITDGLRRRRTGAPSRLANEPAQPVERPAAGPASTWDPRTDRRGLSVSVEGLVHRYPNGIEALRGVDLSVRAGEAIAIVGQNGSGKTTLIKHLNGLLRPTDGRVLLDGADIASQPVNRLAASVGFVFQNPDDQLFERSVDRELAFGPRNLRLGPAVVARNVDAALTAIGLIADRSANPYDLNVSARKLVALGGVLAMDPALLVLDEPTAGQDDLGIARISMILGAMVRAGRTVVAITHDMEFAARNFGRIIVVREGLVIADGPPRRIFSAAGSDLLATAGLEPPPAARIGARLGMEPVPLDADELLARLAETVADQ